MFVLLVYCTDQLDHQNTLEEGEMQEGTDVRRSSLKLHFDSRYDNENLSQETVVPWRKWATGTGGVF